MSKQSVITGVISEFYSRPMGKGFSIAELAEAIEVALRPSFSEKAKKGSPEDGEFAGATFVPERDETRLRGQLLSVYKVMNDGQWRTLPELEDEIGGSQAALSARLRDLRKPEFGGYTVQRTHVRKGLYRYRLLA